MGHCFDESGPTCAVVYNYIIVKRFMYYSSRWRLLISFFIFDLVCAEMECHTVKRIIKNYSESNALIVYVLYREKFYKYVYILLTRGLPNNLFIELIARDLRKGVCAPG